MACTLTVTIATPGFGSGSVTNSYSVPDGSYRSAYKVVTGSAPGNTYDVRVDGLGGTIVLATYTPGSNPTSISSSSVVCPAGTGY
ncbi:MULTISPECIES: hypothetical protein, partial [unclassified Nostoc]|uniref:hypothetical protein n=1 Tax=unclassified Nostoc TaxID=2593658 RepID=UPI00391AFB79